MDNLDINTLNTLKSNGETFESLFGETTDIIIDREKQIEEMQVDLLKCLAFSENGGVKCGDTAKNLYNAGYRKQSEVTEDQRCKEVVDFVLHDYLPRHISKLKKKYTEESGNGR